MSIIALIIFLFTFGMAGLILYVAFKAIIRSPLRDKKDHITLVDEQ